MTSTDNTENSNVTRPRVGRPRSVESRRAIIQSAMNILQNDGYAALNIEAIAAKAGVSKQTIYRWWASAAFIVLEALLAARDLRQHELWRHRHRRDRRRRG